MNNFIVVNSQSRNTVLSSSSSNFSVTLNDKVRLNGRTKVSLEYFVCYATIFQIDSTNNKIDFFENATNKSSTLTSGFYDASTLATEIKTRLDATSGGYNTFTVTYSSSTRKYTISAGNNFRLMFSTGTNASTSAWKVLGFSNSTGTSGIDTTLGTSTTSVDVVNLSLPLSIYIQINNFGSVNFKTTDGDTFTFYIPCTSYSGEVIEYKSANYFEQTVELPPSMNVIDRIDIVLKGRNGSSINLNGSEFQMVLSLK